MLEWVWSVVPYPFPERESGGAVEGGKNGEEFAVVGEGEGVAVPGVGGLGHGIREAEEENRSENASGFFPLFSCPSLSLSYTFYLPRCIRTERRFIANPHSLFLL